MFRQVQHVKVTHMYTKTRGFPEYSPENHIAFFDLPSFKRQNIFDNKTLFFIKNKVTFTVNIYLITARVLLNKENSTIFPPKKLKTNT